jgi:RNA polymerase sigma-70 factor (ECF subfamily)
MGAYSEHTDQELLALLKQSSEAAFTEIYNRYMGLLYIHAFKILKDEQEAEDILQEIFTALWIKGPALVLNNTLSAYLYRAVKNRVFDVLSHRKVKQSYVDSLEEFLNKGQWNTDEIVQEQELARMIESEIALLPKKMREVFELSRISGKSHKEIAHELDISDKTVKKQINNAIKILRVKVNLLIVIMPL